MAEVKRNDLHDFRPNLSCFNYVIQLITGSLNGAIGKPFWKVTFTSGQHHQIYKIPTQG